jgi:outer membrane biosynthesis protein TonB
MLQGEAERAVRQWRYHPLELNGVAQEVDTQITVNFTLGGG